ncbi:MAG: tetratricopeptide repeat protein, partial [Candidatus Kariarchaeaceae archaeon]
EIVEGREKEEGIEELRWRIAECMCRNRKGEYEQVINICKGIKKELEEPMDQEEQQTRKRIRIDAQKEQVWALMRLGRLDEGLAIVDEGIRLVKELEQDGKDKDGKDKKSKANLFNSKGVIYRQKGELDKALNYYEKSLIIKEEIGEKRGIALSLNNIGIVYYQKGEIDQALEYYKKSLIIKEEIGEKRSIALSLNNIGVLYNQKGELNKALEFYEKSLVIKEELGNKQEIAPLLNNIGVLYRMKGELDKALDYYGKSLVIREKLGNIKSIAGSLSNIGELHHEKGELEKAIELQKQSLVLREELGNKLETASSLYRLLRVSIDLGEIQQAKGYLIKLHQLTENEENIQLDLQSRLAEALILKTSRRRKNLTKAEAILEEIVEEEIIFHDFTVHALINLSELLIEELITTGEEEILEEVEKLVEQLVGIAKEQQSFTLLTETYWLKAQLALVRLNITEARSYLSQAEIIAEEKGLERLARKISSEHDQLLDQLDQWEKLIAEDASIAERVKVANLEELMGWMARKREIIIDEKEDEPIMLLLVAESGLPIYSKQFDKSRAMKDILISGFLTSINTFVQEAFDVKGRIRRITHDDYTLSFNLKEPILFCYVYEGQSYTAMKKLDRLITEVHDSEVWPALKEVGRKGYGLNRDDKDYMEAMTGNIFLTN